jgi:hypothetical protein
VKTTLEQIKQLENELCEHQALPDEAVSMSICVEEHGSSRLFRTLPIILHTMSLPH